MTCKKCGYHKLYIKMINYSIIVTKVVFYDYKLVTFYHQDINNQLTY
ncbi:hypothetical protein [Cuspidothrix issatschenkoi]